MSLSAEETRWPAVAKQGEGLDETAPWDATVAVCKMETCTARALLTEQPDSGTGSLERSGLSSLRSGRDCGVDLPGLLRPRPAGELAVSAVVTWNKLTSPEAGA